MYKLLSSFLITLFCDIVLEGENQLSMDCSVRRSAFSCVTSNYAIKKIGHQIRLGARSD